MQLSKGGVVAIGAAAIAFFAVMISYAPQDMKAFTAAQVASGYYAVDDWQMWDGYGGGYDTYEYGYDTSGFSGSHPTTYEYDRGGYYPGGSYGYDEYYEEYWYDDYPRTSGGWGYGGSVSPFPAISTAFASIIPAAARAVAVTNPVYYQQPVIVPAYRTSYIPSPTPAPTPVPQPRPQPRLPQPSCSIVANPSAVTSGGTATLTWGSQYATAATLDAVGSVSPNGSHTITGITSARTYGLAVTGPGGTGACYAFIALRAAAPEMTCLISTNPAIISRGEMATLAWGTSGAVSATMSGGGSQGTVPLSGAIAIAPTYSTNYTISLRDAYGNTQSCTTGILVQ